MPCNPVCMAVAGIGLAMTALVGPARCQQASEATQQPAPAARNPDTALDRWFRMSPEERERELAKLPAERARLIRQQLRRYSEMSPEEKAKLRERYRTFTQLPPNLRQLVRERLEEFRELPPARQAVVHRQVVELRALPEDQRAARLDSDEMRAHFSPEERQIIQDLAQYLDTKN
ncbi:MAG: DUF3106 domain-containing protein [Bryobacteraceae bacterium]|jgi:hypothetical protein